MLTCWTSQESPGHAHFNTEKISTDGYTSGDPVYFASDMRLVYLVVPESQDTFTFVFRLQKEYGHMCQARFTSGTKIQVNVS